MAIIDLVTLRTGVADWLNRSDLTDSQIDDFITIGEARLYEDLRVPPLEVVQSFTVTSTNSSIIITDGLIEIIELKNANKLAHERIKQLEQQVAKYDFLD